MTKQKEKNERENEKKKKKTPTSFTIHINHKGGDRKFNFYFKSISNYFLFIKINKSVNMEYGRLFV